MLDFDIVKDKKTGSATLETSVCGKPLLTTPQLNKSTAFTYEERKEFGLLGKLPRRVETLDEQVKRAYQQFSSYPTRLQQNIYLNNLHDKNQVLFYKLLSHHLAEMLPTIYTPIVGTAVKRFSHEYRQPRGLYISHAEKNNLDEILSNRSNPDIDLIVVTDGEGILGIGDQGVGGMDIPVAKLMVYTLCGGIDPTRTLPIFLDVGTNNQTLLDDPFYLGCRHPRIPTNDYDDFLETFISAIHKKFPKVFLHWEDFGPHNAQRMLSKYENTLCTFNDDIQGTGAVTLAALLAACEITGKKLQDHQIVVFGAGSAGTGISEQILSSFIRLGLKKEAALKHFWLIDKQGLILENDPMLTVSQKIFARNLKDIKGWNSSSTNPSLTDTLRQVKPTILIGCSAVTGAFSQDIIEKMSSFCDRPIIFPLSNPDEKCEAVPKDIITWSKGKALIATGTAFEAVEYQNRMIQIAQCNNALVFPGIGLGILAVGAKKLIGEMIWEACQALSEFSPSKKDSFLPLLPSLDTAQEVAKAIAVAVAKCAIKNDLATKKLENIEEVVEDMFWTPRYLPYRKKLQINEK